MMSTADKSRPRRMCNTVATNRSRSSLAVVASSTLRVRGIRLTLRRGLFPSLRKLTSGPRELKIPRRVWTGGLPAFPFDASRQRPLSLVAPIDKEEHWCQTGGGWGVEEGCAG